MNFDIEEFDVPTEYGKNISFEDQINISKTGTEIILDILKEYNIKATFFCTSVFALNALDIIERIVLDGHEIASHGCTHSKFEESTLTESKKTLETITGIKIHGFRMPKMQYIEPVKVAMAGYKYNSSINPTYLPSRYNYFFKTRICFIEYNIVQMPTTVTPISRIPLFWLTFHNLPLKIYIWLTKRTHKKDNYINVYFHPWEFVDITAKEFGLPNYITNSTGSKMINRFKRYLEVLLKHKYQFCTFSQYINITFNK